MEITTLGSNLKIKNGVPDIIYIPIADLELRVKDGFLLIYDLEIVKASVGNVSEVTNISATDLEDLADQITILTRSAQAFDYDNEVAMGRIPNKSIIDKWGHNENISGTGDYEIVGAEAELVMQGTLEKV